MDPSSLCSQGVTRSEAGLGNGGLNQGGSGLPFKYSGIDQVRPSLGSQLQKPFVETTNQFQILNLQQWLQLLRQELQWQQEQEQQEQQQQLLQDSARLLLAQSRGYSIQASSPKVGVDSQDQEELTMEASTIRSPPINPSPLYSQGVAQSKLDLSMEFLQPAYIAATILVCCYFRLLCNSSSSSSSRYGLLCIIVLFHYCSLFFFFFYCYTQSCNFQYC